MPSDPTTTPTDFSSPPHDPAILGALRLALCTPVREYPPLGDRKAVSILTINGLKLTVALFFSGEISDQAHTDTLLTAAETIAVAVGFAISAFAACVFAFRALVLPMPAMPNGLAYYKHIAARNFETYRAEVYASDDRSILRQMLDYNYTLAVLSKEKFRLLGQSIRCSRLAFILFAVVLVSFVFL